MVRYSARASEEDSGGKSECLISPTVAAESGEVAAEAGHVASESGKVSKTGQVAEARSSRQEVIASSGSEAALGHGEGGGWALQLAFLGVDEAALSIAVHGVVAVVVHARGVRVAATSTDDAIGVRRLLVERAVAPGAALHVCGRTVGVLDHAALDDLRGGKSNQRGCDQQQFHGAFVYSRYSRSRDNEWQKSVGT